MIMPFFYYPISTKINITKEKKEITYSTSGKHGTKTHQFCSFPENIKYLYVVDGIEYTSEKFCNMIIYPNPSEVVDKNIAYYNPLLSNQSVAYKGNIKYIFYNLIPLFMVLIIHIIVALNEKT